MARLKALLVLCAMLALPWQALAQDADLYSYPLQAVSKSDTVRVLDWRDGEAEANFSLPPGLDPQNLRIVLAATPGEPAPTPNARISVSLNGSRPAMLRPDALPFTAQVDFPARYIRAGSNRATIGLVAPEGDCITPANGAWIVDLADSRVELSAGRTQPDSFEDLQALLASEILAPGRVAIDSGALGEDDRAAFEAWSAIALGLATPRPPHFVAGEVEADLIVRYRHDPDAGSAVVEVGTGETPALVIRAASSEAAVATLRQMAVEASSQQGFTTPVFGRSWMPEPGRAAFTVGARPARAILRLSAARSADSSAESRLRIHLNGHELEAAPLPARRNEIALRLPARLLIPGRNEIAFAPELIPGKSAGACLPEADAPRFEISGLRIEGHAGYPADDLYAFASGDFGPPDVSLAMPALTPEDRAAQLHLLAGIARRAGRPPEIVRVTAWVPEDIGSDLIVIGPLSSLPPRLLRSAPDALLAVLRGERPERPRIRTGTSAIAEGVPLAGLSVAGGAARYPLGEIGSAASLTLITEAADASFGATVNALVDDGLLDDFEGRVMRWTRREASMQDRGPWRAPAVTMVAPPRPGELRRTALFLAMIAGLSLGWAMARSRAHPARR